MQYSLFCGGLEQNVQILTKGMISPRYVCVNSNLPKCCKKFLKDQRKQSWSEKKKKNHGKYSVHNNYNKIMTIEIMLVISMRILSSIKRKKFSNWLKKSKPNLITYERPLKQLKAKEWANIQQANRNNKKAGLTK